MLCEYQHALGSIKAGRRQFLGAMDWALWTVSILLAHYLSQVRQSRENIESGELLTVEPIPAGP